jgi:hypothetical protein
MKSDVDIFVFMTFPCIGVPRPAEIQACPGGVISESLTWESLSCGISR